MYQTILTALNNGILTITINRPDKLNALNKAVIAELGQVLELVYLEPEIKAAVITGSGPKSFVAGADISEFSGLDSRGGEAMALQAQAKVFDKIENCPKPVIAAVNGFALGGGCELAMACHFRIAADQARFGQPEVNLGLTPGYGGTQRLTRLIGKGKAMELLMTGNMLDAGEALRLGLVNEVTAPKALLSRCQEILETIIAKAPLAISRIIALVNLADRCDPEGMAREARAFGELFDTADAKEGAAAFLEKRKPVFRGA
ncbi:enoyl-CoA hydratase/isomerase family protein [Flavihumibacter petaseus]|uniref:3-hydroxybutyryl-CoA dehydratase n=1 Tax=Flavihumibacter petaseus NBRC 106054 TaxID=1220578 RepID=A0A0E9MVP8_9BACT|nr:enoyl-CoA hydratase-related protein [Flavihumibacter petaseus]GAO41659.1 3-hydroxybutyryl-CoA dehydratase [Flavihumibacter petaseus NBRC 106054]